MSNSLIPNSKQPLIAVYETNNYTEAHIIVGKLNSEDIPAMVQRESASGAIGISFGPLGVHFVLVHQENADRANEILNTMPPEQEALPDNTVDLIYDWDDDDD